MSVTTITSRRLEKDAQIYRAYVEAKNAKKKITDVAKQFKITRAALYGSLRRVKGGNHRMILKSLQEARNEILWTHKYQILFDVLPKNRKGATIEEIKEMCKSMYTDGFPEVLIARKLQITRSTVRHHLK